MSYIYSNTHQSMCSKAVLLNIFRRFRLLVQPVYIQWSTNEQNKLFYNPPTPSKTIDSLFFWFVMWCVFFYFLISLFLTLCKTALRLLPTFVTNCQMILISCDPIPCYTQILPEPVLNINRRSCVLLTQF
jgi:hypothetical protein